MGLLFCRPGCDEDFERDYELRLPRSMSDSELDACYACSVPFDVLIRRHHCRRCRNIYCRSCSSKSDRLLLYGELQPVRLCDGCANAALAENRFVERHIPLLTDGATLARKQQALLSVRRRQRVFLSVTADLAFLEETEEPEGPEEEEERPPPAFRSGGYAGVGGGPDEAGGRFAAAAAVGGGAATAAGSAARRGMSRGRGGVTRSYPLRDVESVETAIETSGWGRGGDDSGVSALLVIQLRGKEELKLEARSPAERDRWVSALGEASRRARAPALAAEVEEERWRRKDEAAADAQRRRNAQRRDQNAATRAGIAAKYGLDPGRYASRGGGGGRSGVDASGGRRAVERSGGDGAGGAGGRMVDSRQRGPR